MIQRTVHFRQKGDKGDRGDSIRLVLKREGIYVETQGYTTPPYGWDRIAEIGHTEGFGYRSDCGDPSDFTVCPVGDLFVVSGASSDKGRKHTATYKCTAVSATYINGICLEHLEDGEQGPPGDPGNPGNPGHVGRWYYYAGVWKSDADNLYVMEKTQSPFVKCGDAFYMLDFAAYPEYQQSDDPRAAGRYADPSNPANQGGKPWTLMKSEQQYYMAKAFFGEYAQFGSAIINEDWMISTHGRVDGVPKSDNSYTKFDPLFPVDGERTLSGGVTRIFLSSGYLVNSVSLIAGKTYEFKIEGRAASGSSTVRLRKGSTTHEYVTFNSATASVKTIAFTPSASGDYNLYVAVNSGSTEISNVSVSRTGNFVPNYALDMKTGKVYMNDAYVRGDIVSSTLRAEDDNYYTDIRPGVTNWVSKANPLAMISIGVDSLGMFLRMTDKDGSLIWDISTDGKGRVTSGGGNFTEMKYKKMSSARPAVSEFINIREADCTTYYQYNGVYTIDTGGVKTWTPSDEGNKNGIVHTSVSSSATGTNLIAEGYYAKPNNGGFIEDVNGNCTIRLYRYNSSGKLAETIDYTFTR